MSLESQLVKQIKQQIKLEKLTNDMKGEGMYLFENNLKGDLFLPRQTASGRRLVKKGEQFIGDNYYFGMVRTNELRLVREIQAPQDKLITEQPPVVTREGATEFVEVKNTNKGDVLLTEHPTDGIKVIRGV